MNIENVKSLFTMFSWEENTEKYEALITLAMTEVEKMLLPEADENDIRLNFLCAALANFRYRQALSVADRSEYTYAGRMLSTEKDGHLSFSENLLRDYCRLCSDLIKNTDFIFMGVS